MKPYRLVSICRSVAPDLAAFPLYIAFASGLFPRGAARATLVGCAATNLDLYLRPHLAWEGRGPAMLIDDAIVWQVTTGLAVSLDGSRRAVGSGDHHLVTASLAWHLLRAYAAGLVAVAMHELAHLVEFAIVDGYRWPVPPSESDCLAYRSVEALYTEANDRAASVDDPPSHHGPIFTRIALHLRQRACRAGFGLSAMDVLGASFDRAVATAAELALVDEPARMIGCSFGEVLALSPPAAFNALWPHESVPAAAAA